MNEQNTQLSPDESAASLSYATRLSEHMQRNVQNQDEGIMNGSQDASQTLEMPQGEEQTPEMMNAASEAPEEQSGATEEVEPTEETPKEELSQKLDKLTEEFESFKKEIESLIEKSVNKDEQS